VTDGSFARLFVAACMALGVPDAVGAQPTASAANTPQQAAPSAKPKDVPDTDYAEPAPAVPPRLPATAFMMPDVPDVWNQHTSYDGRLFSTRFSYVPILDYNAFVQDENSKAQTGEENDEWDLRTMRLMFRGQMKFALPVSYFVSIEVKGKDHVQDDDSSFGLTDLEISTSLGKLGTLKYGKIKEPFVYEMVGDAANLQQLERALNPFFASRGIGLRWTKPLANDSMSVSLGWFNDWYVQSQSFRVSGNNFAARLTGVPYWTDDGANYLHVAASMRYVGSDEGTLRLRGRPESNVTNYYVDSGSFVGDHANSLGLESAWGRGPLFVTGEYARSWVDAPESFDPRFWGTYVTVSYVLTGEHRPYDKQVAYARRIMPVRKWGAWELVGRYSHVDITDKAIDGGIFDRTTVGINWWATRRWKVGFDYGLIELDRKGMTGTTHAFHTRFQWVY
jgi:phosphate-selective porin